MRNEYRVIAKTGVHETEVQRSRFICALAPAGTEPQAQEFIAGVRAAHPDASHHCWAYVIGADAGVQRASDDGEPTGTAGAPMLQMLLRREMRYTVAVVTRYFGGTKLGAGGLIRAYGGAVGAALDVLGTVTHRLLRQATITVDYHHAGRIENDLRATGCRILDVDYGEVVEFTVAVPDEDLDSLRNRLADATAGSARLEPGAETYGQA